MSIPYGATYYRELGGVKLVLGQGNNVAWNFGVLALGSGAGFPLFADHASGLAGTGEGKTVLLYQAARDAWGRDLDPGPQKIGDCVSWGNAGAADLALCVEATLGTAEYSWDQRVTTEAVYALSRVEYGNLDGSYSDGSVGAWAAEALLKGGTLPRTKLGPYDPQRAKQWGAKGLPDDLEPEARKHLCQQVTLVTSFEQARDAIANGYPVAVCSGVGFEGGRDSQGFVRARGSWAHCVLPDEIISGPEPFLAKDMAAGRLVYCHDGKPRPISEVYTRRFAGDLVRLKLAGLPPLRVTPDHPVLVYRKVKKAVTARPGRALAAAGVGPRTFAWESVEPAWVKASEVTGSDFLVTPAPPAGGGPECPAWADVPRAKNVPLPLSPHPDIAWLFGLYIADGNTVRRHKVVITLSSSEGETAARARAAFALLGLKARLVRKETFVRVVADSAPLAESFRSWFGGASHEKRVPAFLLSGWDLRSLVEGVLAGDGCEYGRRRVVSTTSRVLAYQLHQILAGLGEAVMVNAQKRGPGCFANARPMWTVNWVADRKKAGWNKFARNHYLVRVRAVEAEPYDGEVYDCLVPGAHSFVAGGVAVHNCMKFVGVLSGAREGLLCMNSWGNDHAGEPKGDHDIPDNAWWVEKATVDRMLREQDSFAISGPRGYERRTLPWIF